MKNKSTKLTKLLIFIFIKYPILHIILFLFFSSVLFSIAKHTKLNEYQFFYYDVSPLINENQHIELELKDPIEGKIYEGFWVTDNEKKHNLYVSRQGANKYCCILDEANNIDVGKKITLYIKTGEITLLEKFIDNIRGAHERD